MQTKLHCRDHPRHMHNALKRALPNTEEKRKKTKIEALDKALTVYVRELPSKPRL